MADFNAMLGAALLDRPVDYTEQQKLQVLANIGGASSAEVIAADARAKAAQDAGMILSSAKGDRGPGYAETNLGALYDWIAAIDRMSGNKGGYLQPRGTPILQPLDLSDRTLAGVNFHGAAGLSKLIVESADPWDGSPQTHWQQYAVVNLPHLDNTWWHGVDFESLVVNPVEDGGSGLVRSWQRNIRSSGMVDCGWSGANVATNAVSLYPRINATDVSAIVDGWSLIRPRAVDIGRMFLTIISRGILAPDPHKACRRILIDAPTMHGAGKALPAYGTVDPNSPFQTYLHGMLVSFDGVGEDVLLQDAVVSDSQGLLLEIVAYDGGLAGPLPTWRNLNVKRISVSDTSRGVIPLSIDDHGGKVQFHGINIDALKIVGDPAGTRRSNLFGLQADCSITNCDLIAEAGDAVVAIRRGNGFLSSRNVYKNVNPTTGRFAAIVDQGGGFCSHRDEFDCQGSGTFAVIRFDGASTSDTTLVEPIISKGRAGALVDETGGADGNAVVGRRTATDRFPDRILNYTMPADADFTLSAGEIIDYDVVRVLPPVIDGVPVPVTVPRTMTFNPPPGAKPIVWNSITQALIVRGGALDTFVFPQQRAQFFWDDQKRLQPFGTGYYSSAYSATNQGLHLGHYRLYVDANGGWRAYLGTGSNRDPAAQTSGYYLGMLGATYTTSNLPSTNISGGARANFQETIAGVTFAFVTVFEGNRWVPERPPRGTLAQIEALRAAWPSGFLTGQQAFVTNGKALNTDGTVETNGASGVAATLIAGTWRITGTNIAVTA